MSSQAGGLPAITLVFGGARSGKSRFAEGHRGRDGKKVADRQVDQFTKEAGVVRIADESDISAHVVVPA